MTGGGFGGCAVALVHLTQIGEFAAAVASTYQAKSGLESNIYICQATNGAELIAG